MKKLFMTVTTVVLAIVIFISGTNLGIEAYADELDLPVEQEDDDPYVYVRDSSCHVSISSGIATVTSVVTGKAGTTSTSVTVYLEKFVAGSWQPYTSWSHSSGKDQSNSDSTSVTSGAYRVWMSVTASGTGGSESFNVDGNTAGC